MFKLDGLHDPKPWKLWERTKNWNVEDLTLFGGATGLLLASNPRLFPGVTGFRRFLGITIAGCAIGAKTAEFAFSKGPPYAERRTEWLRALRRRAAYGRLSTDEEAKASLSRFGQSLLMAYTADSAILRTLSRPFQGLDGVDEAPIAVPDSQLQALQQMQMQQAQGRVPVILLTEFQKEELAAPDYEGAHRQYLMDPTDIDIETLKDHLKQLNKLRTVEVKELAYAWRGLAQKEHDLHRLSQEDPEKDMLRRELQLLNSLATHISTRIAVITYAQADTRKRIGQIENEDPASLSTIFPLKIEEDSILQDGWRDTFAPQSSVERIRQRWENARVEWAGAEHVLSHLEKLKAQGRTNNLTDEQADQLRKNAEQMKKNFMATERLLKEYEDQIHKADSSNGN